MVVNGRPISDIALNEAHATIDAGQNRLFARFHVHMHAAPLLRLVGIDVRHPFQYDGDPQSLRGGAGLFGVDAALWAETCARSELLIPGQGFRATAKIDMPMPSCNAQGSDRVQLLRSGIGGCRVRSEE